ncbi:MAG: hypothetical protein ABEH81_01295 [Halopenitus sp.]
MSQTETFDEKTPATKVVEMLHERYNNSMRDNTFSAADMVDTADLNKGQVTHLLNYLRTGRWEGVKIKKLENFAKRYEIEKVEVTEIDERVVVDNELCGHLRREMAELESIPELIDKYGFAKNTVTKHVTGRCMCKNDEATYSYHGRGNGWHKDEDIV